MVMEPAQREESRAEAKERLRAEAAAAGEVRPLWRRRRDGERERMEEAHEEVESDWRRGVEAEI